MLVYIFPMFLICVMQNYYYVSYSVVHVASIEVSERSFWGRNSSKGGVVLCTRKTSQITLA